MTSNGTQVAYIDDIVYGEHVLFDVLTSSGHHIKRGVKTPHACTFVYIRHLPRHRGSRLYAPRKGAAAIKRAPQPTTHDTAVTTIDWQHRQWSLPSKERPGFCWILLFSQSPRSKEIALPQKVHCSTPKRHCNKSTRPLGWEPFWQESKRDFKATCAAQLTILTHTPLKRCLLRGEKAQTPPRKLPCRVAADVWKKDVWVQTLGVPGQVWEFRFLPSFPSLPKENRSSRDVWENAWKFQTSFFQTSAAFWPWAAALKQGSVCGDARLIACICMHLVRHNVSQSWFGCLSGFCTGKSQGQPSAGPTSVSGVLVWRLQIVFLVCVCVCVCVGGGSRDWVSSGSSGVPVPTASPQKVQTWGGPWAPPLRIPCQNSLSCNFFGLCWPWRRKNSDIRLLVFWGAPSFWFSR